MIVSATGDLTRRELSARHLARSTLFNLVGLGVPLLVGLLVMPVLARHLGPARFGLLGLAWALLEYFSLFDVGLGRATTKFVAERMASGGDASQLVVVSLLVQAALGVAAGLGLAALSPILVTSVLRIEPSLQAEAMLAFYLIAATVPAMLLVAALRGVLEAAQRFDLVAYIRIPTSILTFVLPAVVVVRGVRLPGILALLLAVRLVSAAALAFTARRVVGGEPWRWPRDWGALRSLMQFGGWVAVSNVVSPLFLYLDRFLLGAVAGVIAVGYYTIPFEASVRLLIIAGSLAATIYPTVAALAARDEARPLERLFASSLRSLTLALTVPVAALLIFAGDLLTVWMGADFAAQGAVALRLLAAGVLITSLAFVPYSYLQALHRPDLTAKFHLIELVAYVPFAYWSVSTFGVTGAALAWSARVTVDAVLLVVAGGRLVEFSPVGLVSSLGLSYLGALVLLATSFWVASTLVRDRPAAAIAVAVAGATGFALVVWRRVMSDEERATVTALGRRPSVR